MHVQIVLESIGAKALSLLKVSSDYLLRVANSSCSIFANGPAIKLVGVAE
jgi:hypothetical protein